MKTAKEARIVYDEKRKEWDEQQKKQIEAEVEKAISAGIYTEVTMQIIVRPEVEKWLEELGYRVRKIEENYYPNRKYTVISW